MGNLSIFFNVIEHLWIVYTQDSRKIPTLKGSSWFWSKCVKIHWRSGTCCWIYWAWIKSHYNQWGEKERKGKKNKRNPFTSFSYRPDLMCMDPFGPHDTDISSFQTMTIWLIQGYRLILGLLKIPISNIRSIYLVKKLLWKVYRFIYPKWSTLNNLGVSRSKLLLSHLCWQSIKPGTQIRDQ